MNFEPCNPPLLDPFITEQFDREQSRKQAQSLRHNFVLQRLSHFLPNKHKPDRNMFDPSKYNTHINTPTIPILYDSTPVTPDHQFTPVLTIPTPKRAKRQFTYSQSVALNDFYEKHGVSNMICRVALANELGLDRNDVLNWFQARKRRDKKRER